MKKAVFDGNGVKEAEDKTVVTETYGSSHVATGSFPTHDRVVERDIEKDDYVPGVESLHGRSQSNAASADGEEKRGDEDDPGGHSNIGSLDGICHNTDSRNKVEGKAPKRIRML